jgi:short-subunit dehydrogenase
VKDHYSGKTVLITGGSSGIGRALARQLALFGANVLIVSKNRDKNQDTENELRQLNKVEISSFLCDIGNPKEVEHMGRAVIDKYGAPDILINNAGFAWYHSFIDMSFSEAITTANVNFVGTVAVTHMFCKAMAEKPGSQIVIVASIAGALPITPNSVYGAAKRGLHGFSLCLSAELENADVDVITVFPGRVVTPFFDHPSYETRDAGPETKLVTPIDVIVKHTLAGIAKGKKRIFIPKYWSFVSYLYAVDPIFFRRFYHWLLSRRLNRLSTRK